MNHILLIMLSYSILPAAFIVLARFRQMSRMYFPFMIFILAGAGNEILSTVLSYQGVTIAVNNNIYMLIEALLLTWQFKRWNGAQAGPFLFTGIGFSIIIVWVGEIFYYGILHQVVYFSLYYCFLVVILSLLVISRMVITYKGILYRNPVFIICTSFLVYFLCRLLLDSCWYLGLLNSNSFQRAIFSIMAGVNFLINIVYGITVIWISTKKKFSSSSPSHVVYSSCQ